MLLIDSYSVDAMVAVAALSVITGVSTCREGAVAAEVVLGLTLRVVLSCGLWPLTMCLRLADNMVVEGLYSTV
jgi:hypothetical protein